VSFVQDANTYFPLVDEIIGILEDIKVSHPGGGMRDILARMIARYVTTIYSKELQGQ
jgi:hypothetical protein